MEYEVALSLAWRDLAAAAGEKNYSLRFLGDEYSIDLGRRRVLSLSCNAPAKTHYSILLLHYLIRRIKGLPGVKGEWISFKELAGGQAYYPAFKKRVIDTIVRKYKDKPEALWELSGRFCAKRTQLANISIALETFAGVPILLSFWRGDAEFPAEANILFDKTISGIFCTEDIVVLAEIVAHSI